MFKKVLIPIDLTNRDNEEKAVAVAIQQVQISKASLHVMTVVPEFGLSLVGAYFPKDYEEKAIEEANVQLHEYVKETIPAEIKVQHIVAHGTIYSEILRIAEEIGCDLIVMASHRPELRDYLLGPNAARVVRHAACSVLVVRQ